jgi:hypothetical protein
MCDANPNAGALMTTARLTISITPSFKTYLSEQAEREGVSGAEWVRRRCEPKKTNRKRPDATRLAELTSELRDEIEMACTELRTGLAEAQSILAELRARREESPGARAGTGT